MRAEVTMAFRDVIGHQQLVGLLVRSILRETLPPSLIFAGPSGIGKKLTALAVAQGLNCVSPLKGGRAQPSVTSAGKTRLSLPVAKHGGSGEQVMPSTLELDACGVCVACRRIARGIHPDVIVVEPGDSGTIRIDQVREILDRVAYRPFEGRVRVAILDDADLLVTAAQNALLKTLEEPPNSSVFILVTSRPDALLPTVQSRCPRLRFGPLGVREIAAALVRLGRDERAAWTAAATADGSVERALDLAAGELDESRAIAGRVLDQAASERDARRRIESAAQLLPRAGGGAIEREHLAGQLAVMASLLRDAELLASGASSAELANPDLQPEVERLARSYSGERGVRAFDAVCRAWAALDRSANAKIVADWVVLQL
jgi:DNA polymerase III subunit delta'